jgi:NitT/TauT family transport system substrate-binding protein
VLAAPTVVRAQTATVRVLRGSVEASAAASYAQSLGLFKQAGLDVDIQVVGSGEVAAAAIIGGSAEVGAANLLSIAVAHQKGVGFTILAPGSEYRSSAPTFALVVARDSPIRGARDLPGKTVAVFALNDLGSMTTQFWLEKAGVDPKSVKFVEIPQPQMQIAMERGTVDAVTIGSPALDAAMQSGRVVGLPYDAVGSRFAVNGWYAKREWVAAHRDVAHKFAAAVFQAQAWANRNIEASGKMLADITKLDPAVIARMTRTTFAERFEPGLIQPLIELAARYKLIPASFPATQLYDPTL